MNSCRYTIFNLNIVDYYINTIDDMQNEKDFFYHYKLFEYMNIIFILWYSSKK